MRSSLDIADHTALAFPHKTVGAFGLADPDRIALRHSHQSLTGRRLATWNLVASGVMIDLPNGASRTCRVCVARAEKTVRLHAVLHASGHRNEVTALGVVATILDLRRLHVSQRAT